MDKKSQSLKIWTKLVNLTKGGAIQTNIKISDLNIIEVLDSNSLYELDQLQFPELTSTTENKSALYKTQLKKKHNEKKRQEPRYPDPDECCNTNCNDCVYIMYNIELEEYEKWCILNPSTESESEDYDNYD